MPFSISPGVNVTEKDLTTGVAAVSTSDGAISGIFRWGPVGKIVLVDSEPTLVNRYGKPTNLNAETFFVAANFLAYSNSLLVNRSANTTDAANGTLSAVGNTDTVNAITTFSVPNENLYDSMSNNFASDSSVLYFAKYPGAIGNSLRVSVCDSANAFASNLALTNCSFNVGSNSASLNFTDVAGANAAWQTLTNGDYLVPGNTSIGTQYIRITDKGAQPSGNTITVSLADRYALSTNFSGSNTLPRVWEFYHNVDGAPSVSNYQSLFGNSAAIDELHVVVVDQNGLFSGVPGTVLEVFQNVSRATDAKSEDGSTNFYKTVINLGSQYIWYANDRVTAPSNTAINLLSSISAAPLSLQFNMGQDGPDEATVPFATLAKGWDIFKSAEDSDISLIISGKARGGTNGEQLANYITDNILTTRLDVMAFYSPDKSDVVNAAGSENTNLVQFVKSLNSSSYWFLTSSYKYQYDKYNDVYRYIPGNGDDAGLCARTDLTNDAWWSPAGYNRGQYKNLIRLAYNPGKTDRDLLYKNSINPVTTFPGQGTYLYGDKTGINKPSAFDRINVRRLFIVLEKAISNAAKFTLFEFNDTFTRARFKNLVEPFLRDVLGRRGIYDFLVVCDETNNTAQVIDSNQFVGDIYIKPAKSINFINLNFVAVRDGVEFSEIVGQN